MLANTVKIPYQYQFKLNIGSHSFATSKLPKKPVVLASLISTAENFIESIFENRFLFTSFSANSSIMEFPHNGGKWGFPKSRHSKGRVKPLYAACPKHPHDYVGIQGCRAFQ